MAKNLVYVGVIVLAVIAVFLGYKIYQQQTLTNKTSVTNQQPQKRSTPKPRVNQTTPEATQPQTQQPSASEISAVLNLPGPNATEAERKKRQDLINKLGSSSDITSLDIAGCIPNPVVYSVRKGTNFKVKNPDQIDHTIYTTIRTTIKANSEQTLTSKDIGDNFGDYAYGCNGEPNSVGIIRIVP